MTRFEQWWYEEGSKPLQGNDDWEEHCKKMCAIAWANGAYVEREECAKLVESSIYDWKIDATNPHEWDELAIDLSNAIVNRTRGQE